MSRLLLTILLFCVSLGSKSQVILNEIHTEVKKSTESEFFELFNTSTDPAGINLDCYSLVVPYITASNTVGVYLLDFPNVTILARSYLVATSSTKIVGGNVQFNTQNKTNVIANFSWNLLNVPNQQPLNGSLRSFVPVGEVGVSITTNNLFAPTTGQTLGGPILGVFLFKNSEYVNGFLAGYSSFSVPNTIQQLGQISNFLNQCGSYSIDFSKIKTAEQSGESIGSSNGYRRSGDGLCGSWVKSASGESPGERNGTTTSIPLTNGASNLGAYEGFNCNGKLEVQVTSPLSSGLYPITITVVRDTNGNSAVDLVGAVKDELLFTQAITGPMSAPLELSAISTASNIIVVYQTAIGCIDRVALAKVPIGTYTTITNRICNTIEYTLSGYSGGAVSTTAAPIKVNIYEDLGTVGTFNPGIDNLISATTITATDVNANVKKIELPAQYTSSSIIVVYSSLNYSCYISKVEVPQVQAGSINTSETFVCDDLSFSITQLNDQAQTRTNALSVQLYGKLNDGSYSAVLNSKDFTAPFTSGGWQSSFTVPRDITYTAYELQYSVAGYSCFNKTVAPSPVAISYKTTQTDFCKKQVEVKIEKPQISTPNLPFSVKIYLIIKDNGKLGVFEKGIDDIAAVAPVDVSTFPGIVSFASLPVELEGKTLLIGYETPYPCFNKVMPLSLATATLNTVQNSFCGENTNPSTVSFEVKSITGAAATFGYPISVDLYTKDLKTKLGSTSLTEVPSTGLFEVSNTFRSKELAIIYRGVNSCFSSSAIIPAACLTTPVKFSYFSVKRNFANAKQVQLSWETTFEQNNKGFYLHRMVEGGEWQDIGFVPTAAQNGNSYVPLRYSFTDVNLYSGTSYYRIYQVDFDGKADYSEVKSIDGNKLFPSGVAVYPNPAQGGRTMVAFASEQPKLVVLSDASGRTVQQWQNYSGNMLHLQSLQPGFYMLKVVNMKTGTRIVEKLVVQ